MSADAALELESCHRVRRALEALARLGPVSQILDRAAPEAAAAADLDRLVLSRTERGTLAVLRVYLRDEPQAADRLREELVRSPRPLAYPLLECELLRRRQARLVADVDRTQPGRYAFFDALGWSAYVAAPVIVDGTVVGFLHGDRAPQRRALSALDVGALEQFAAGFALVFERAVLRRRLRDQRREIRRIASWAEARTGDLSDGVIALSGDDPEESRRQASAPELQSEDGLATNLTARELDVLRLMADGMTNGDIAQTLFVSQGTVKFHVKNILRKMQASNRSDAGSRYLRLTLPDRAATPPRAG